MDRESSRLFREARRAQRNLRGPAGAAAAAELGRAAAQAASTEYTGRARDLQRGGLRQQAALAAGYRPAGNSLLGPTATLQPLRQAAAPAAQPVQEITRFLDATSMAQPTAPAAPPTAAATHSVDTSPPAPPVDMVTAPQPVTPKSLRRAAAAYSGTIGGGTTPLGDVAVGASDGVKLLTPEGASARIRREASERNVPRTDILDEINRERATVGQAPMKIDWQKDVLPYDVAKAEGEQRAAATLAGDAAAAQAARELNVAKPPLFVGPPASAAAPAPVAPPAPPPAREPYVPATLAEGLSQDFTGLVDKEKELSQAALDAMALAGQSAKQAAANSTKSLRQGLSSAVASAARVATSPAKMVGGDTGKLLRKTRQQIVDRAYNATR